MYFYKVENKNYLAQKCNCPLQLTVSEAFSCKVVVISNGCEGVKDKSSHTHTHTLCLCFSSEEHTLSSGVWRLRHSCLPHVSCAVHPLHHTGGQVAPGQLFTRCSYCTISYREYLYFLFTQSFLFLVFGLYFFYFISGCSEPLSLYHFSLLKPKLTISTKH